MAQHLVCQIPDRSQCIQSRKFCAMKRALMLLWFKDFMNVTEKLQFINLSCNTAFIRGVMRALDRSVETLGP